MKKLEHEMNLYWEEHLAGYNDQFAMTDAQDRFAYDLMEIVRESYEEFKEKTLPYLKASLEQLSDTIHTIKNTRVTVLDFSDLCGKFAVLIVAVYECLGKLISWSGESEKKQRYRRRVLYEADQFVEECPAPLGWYEVRKLPLEVEKDPDLVFNDVRV